MSCKPAFIARAQQEVRIYRKRREGGREGGKEEKTYVRTGGVGGEEGATEGGLVYLVGVKGACSDSTSERLTGMCDLSSAPI